MVTPPDPKPSEATEQSKRKLSKTMNPSHPSSLLPATSPHPQPTRKDSRGQCMSVRHTELPFSQRAAKSLPGRRTAGDTNRGLVAQGDGWNHVRLVKIQGENISPSAHSQVSNELVLVLRNPHSHTRDCGLWGSWLRERFPRPRRQWWGRGGRRAKPPGRVWERRSLPLANGSASAPPQP